jgi:hypothetical protein
MIETGIKTLKINAIKINKTLAEGNKSMKKLRAEEQTLFKVQQNKIKLKQREDLIEDKKKQKFGSGIAKKVIQPARSFIDKLKDFFILLGAGILVNSLPAIIASIEKFTEDNKGLIDNIKFIVGEIGKLSIMFIELTQKLTPGKEEQIKKDLDELSKFLGETDGSEVDESLKELKDIEKGLGTPIEALGSLPINPNPIPPDQRLEAPINSESNKPVQVVEFNSAAKKVIEIVNNNNSPTNTKVFLPGVGYAYRSPTALGSSSPKFEGPSGTPMTKEEFFTESRKVEENIKGYSKGGTVKGTSYDSGKLTLDSKPIRTGSGVESFSVFKKTTIAQANNLGEKTKSNNLLEDLVDNVKKLFGFEDKDKDKDDDSNSSDQSDGLPDGLPDSSNPPIASNAKGDKALLAAIAALEGGNAQSRADVAQSIYNRAADPEKRYGSNIREVITSDGQYQPAYINPNVSSGPGTKVDPIWKKVNDRDSAIDAMMSYFAKRKQFPSRESVGKIFDRSVAAIGNRNMQVQAAKHVGGRTEFLGAGSRVDSRDRAEVRSRGTALDNQFFTAYGTGGDTNESIKRGPAPVPKNLFQAPLLRGLQVNNPNIDRSSILSMQSPNDVSASTLLVVVKQDTIITEDA